jgi:hypothetical protein
MNTKKWYQSKINWAAILVLLIAIEPVIENQDFSGMGIKQWVTFGIGIFIIIFRTFATNTTIGNPPATV